MFRLFWLGCAALYIGAFIANCFIVPKLKRKETVRIEYIELPGCWRLDYSDSTMVLDEYERCLGD